MALAPRNEIKRLEALRRYHILDTEPEAAFDDFAKLASFICGTPMATITLVDLDRQWFKAKVGMDRVETPRNQSFCTHTILANEVMVVEDALIDGRFLDSPLVTGDPHIRFYAGAPLLSPDGHAVGSLCALDQRPRKLDVAGKTMLQTLARRVMEQMELRRVSHDLAAALEDLKTLRDLLPICSHCKGIRNDGGYWQRVEDYLFTSSGTDLTHGICPACAKKHYPGLSDRVQLSGAI